MHWNEKVPALKIGEKVVQATKMARVEYKKGMVFIHQQRHLYSGMDGGAMKEGKWAVKEVRTHVFRQDEEPGERFRMQLDSANVDQAKSSPAEPEAEPKPTPDVSLTYLPTSPLLFRYSALTFNAHKVHYDRPWTQTMEGHPDLLVHGPLTATLLIELAGQSGGILRHFSYRAVKPLYVDREIKLNAKWAKGEEGEGEGEGDGNGGWKSLKLWAEQEGRVGMKANAWLG